MELKRKQDYDFIVFKIKQILLNINNFIYDIIFVNIFKKPYVYLSTIEYRAKISGWLNNMMDEYRAKISCRLNTLINFISGIEYRKKADYVWKDVIKVNWFK